MSAAVHVHKIAHPQVIRLLPHRLLGDRMRPVHAALGVFVLLLLCQRFLIVDPRTHCDLASGAGEADMSVSLDEGLTRCNMICCSRLELLVDSLRWMRTSNYLLPCRMGRLQNGVVLEENDAWVVLGFGYYRLGLEAFDVASSMLWTAACMYSQDVRVQARPCISWLQDTMLTTTFVRTSAGE